MDIMKNCPICKTEVEECSLSDFEARAMIGCPRCGEFQIGEMTMLFKGLIEQSNNYAIISYWIRANQSEKLINLTPDLLKSILNNTTLPKPKEQADNFILWMGKSVNSPEEEVIKTYNEIASIIGATDKENVRYIITHLKDNGLINTYIDSGSDFQGHLTFGGWERYDELLHSNKDSKLAFMAMQFNNVTLTKIFNDVIKKAVDDTGFKIHKLDEAHRAGSIDDKLRVEIRRSRFIISDLTDDNNGAYWEAGFAEGLGMPVIYICEENKFNEKKTHFDTNHHLTVLWKDDEESLKKFAEELKDTIRETLHVEADMED